MTVLPTIAYACVIAALALLAIGVGASLVRLFRQERASKLREMREPHADRYTK